MNASTGFEAAIAALKFAMSCFTASWSLSSIGTDAAQPAEYLRAGELDHPLAECPDNPRRRDCGLGTNGSPPNPVRRSLM